MSLIIFFSKISLWILAKLFMTLSHLLLPFGWTLSPLGLQRFCTSFRSPLLRSCHTHAHILTSCGGFDCQLSCSGTMLRSPEFSPLTGLWPVLAAGPMLAGLGKLTQAAAVRRLWQHACTGAGPPAPLAGAGWLQALPMCPPLSLGSAPWGGAPRV